ncbi:MAG: ribonuclease III [Firmicutes bacterium]|nr:ribonuclease III [Bacillota bacterium]
MNDLNEFSQQLDNVEAALGIVFNDREILFRSLVHDSFVYENEEIKRSNERLEFLGDSVLGLIISHLIYTRYPNWQEGDLALLKSSLVSSESLAERAKNIDLGSYLFLGKGEDASGGRHRASILSDALEALIGAIFLDQGFDIAYKFVETIFNECLDVKTPLKDFKSYLQEYSQKHFKALPNYNVVDEIGPPHRKVFKVKVEVGSVHNGEGEGTSKKEAEQSAARNLLEKITGTF